MNLRLKACLFLAVVAATSLASSSAKAQFFGGGCGFGYGWGYGIPYNVYGQDSIPYFALYPPVYYSHPVPRPYGFSPFAYPPGVTTPNGVAFYSSNTFSPQARHRVNSRAAVKTAAAPLVIENPYFQKEGKAMARSASPPQPQPLVVYPQEQFAKQAKLARTDLDR